MLFDSFSKLFSNCSINIHSSNIDSKGNKLNSVTLNEYSALKTENLLFTRPNFGLM
ncbi:hypothetical protein RB653_005898 [Dictyostelium firmibasis]|uniref:Uncharacterized protein n=1 Tax=Dictyostelium firmibasis TaxID=79012 RepID=A0AAN7UB20_9MYCE